jgi:Ser/Thr protein kinase RdoA (MazF antagonist)
MTDSHPFAALSPDVIMDAVESVGFRPDARIQELNSYENRVVQIGIEDSTPVIGKFYRAERWTDEQILEEHDFTLELAELELSVVPPLLIDDSTLHEHADFRFAVYPQQGGRAPAIDDVECLKIIARSIARIHACGSRQGFIDRPHFTITEFGHDARDFLLDEGFIPPGLLEAYSTVSAQLLDELETHFSRVSYHSIRLHGDCHMGNVLWRNEIPHFVDFDDARNGPAVQDLWMLLSGDREMMSIQLDAILRAYTGFCEFDYATIPLIEPLRALRMLYHTAWIARRWHDPAFPRAFPFFAAERYWSDHILELREQTAMLYEPPLAVSF